MVTRLSPQGTTARKLAGGGSCHKVTGGQIGWSSASAEGHFHLAVEESEWTKCTGKEKEQFQHILHQ